MSIVRRLKREVPGLNTSSLPDLIFSVLFFFMIVTHMRKVTLKMKYNTPAGTELSQLTRKTTTTYIYIGRPMNSNVSPNADNFCIQVNDKVVSLSELQDFLKKERKAMETEGDSRSLAIRLKADRNTPMGVIEEVKQALRQAQILNISYDAVERSCQDKNKTKISF